MQNREVKINQAREMSSSDLEGLGNRRQAGPAQSGRSRKQNKPGLRDDLESDAVAVGAKGLRRFGFWADASVAASAIRSGRLLDANFMEQPPHH